MSIIDDIEKNMKRYDYLSEKQKRRNMNNRELSKEQQEELLMLRPNVFTPITMLFELLYETISQNQETRKVKIEQKGGAEGDATAQVTQTKANDDVGEGLEKSGNESKTKSEEQAKKAAELEEAILPLLTKLIVFIEQNKKNAEKKKDENTPELYPDIGTSAKNSAILVVRKIKKWWNDLIQGGTSDLASKINLKKALPTLPNGADDMNAVIKKAETAVKDPLARISKLLSNDVRDIASSSVEGIMNALSLIPGIGTTLQLWRLLQNVIVIMSKSVTTMAEVKKEGETMKQNVNGLKGAVENAGNGAAQALVDNVQANVQATANEAAQSLVNNAQATANEAAQSLVNNAQANVQANVKQM
jgi:hypothetical protein